MVDRLKHAYRKASLAVFSWLNFKTKPEVVGILEEAVENNKLHLYKKVGRFHARPAVPGETVDTVIDGILETTNTAQAGDMVLTGTRGEEWILSAQKFAKMYEATPDEPGIFRPKGHVLSMKVQEKLGIFSFLAPWGERMLEEPGDRLVLSEANNFVPEEAYRIERLAFHQTMAPCRASDLPPETRQLAEQELARLAGRPVAIDTSHDAFTAAVNKQSETAQHVASVFSKPTDPVSVSSTTAKKSCR